MLGALIVAVGLLAQPPAEPEPVYKIRRATTPGTTVRTPRDAVVLALADAEALGEAARYVRYVWVPDWIEPASGFAQVGHIANSTFTRTVNMVQPVALAEGRLLRLDLAKFIAYDWQLGEVANLYELLAEHDSYFNTLIVKHGPVATVVAEAPAEGDAVQLKLQGGNWGDGKLGRRDGERWGVLYGGTTHPTSLTSIKWHGKLLSEYTPPDPVPDHGTREFVAAAYLNPEGAKLFALTKSGVPIMRLDEWVAFTFSSVNGGLYYKLTGIGDTLAGTVREFCGEDAARKVQRATAALHAAEDEARKRGEHLMKVARLDPELAKAKAIIETSEVTGRQRMVVFFYGAATAPTAGVQLIAITFDIAEDNAAVESDPYRNAAVFEKYNGGECIFALPNGMLAYVVFNQDDKIIASVPDGVAHDFTAREVRANVATVRVFSGVACAHCHDKKLKNWGWQPVVNDLYDTSRSLTKILDDAGRRSSVEALQLLTAQYGASTDDLNVMLDQARIPYQHRAHLATNMATTREVVAGIADSYWGYWYDRVTPVTAALDFGQALDKEQAQLFLLRAIDPAPTRDVQSLLLEDGVLARVKDGAHVTPVQWRVIYPNAAERLFFKKAEGAQP